MGLNQLQFVEPRETCPNLSVRDVTAGSSCAISLPLTQNAQLIVLVISIYKKLYILRYPQHQNLEQPTVIPLSVIMRMLKPR